jgi:hypothetical protein
MHKLQTSTELTKDGKTKPISYGGDGKRAIRELLDRFVEQFTRDENGDWLFGGFSAAQLEGFANELKKRNSRAWRKIKKHTKRIYSRSINESNDDAETEPLVVCPSESSCGPSSDEGGGCECKLGCCSSSDSDPAGGDTGLVPDRP